MVTSPIFGDQGALAMLRRRMGSCTDFATFYVSMLGTAHIPARVLGGYLLDSATATNAFHDRVQFYLSGIETINADPTCGSAYFGTINDTYHIALYFGLESNITTYRRRAGSRAVTPSRQRLRYPNKPTRLVSGPPMIGPVSRSSQSGPHVYRNGCLVNEQMVTVPSINTGVAITTSAHANPSHHALTPGIADKSLQTS